MLADVELPEIDSLYTVLPCISLMITSVNMIPKSLEIVIVSFVGLGYIFNFKSESLSTPALELLVIGISNKYVPEFPVKNGATLKIIVFCPAVEIAVGITSS